MKIKLCKELRFGDKIVRPTNKGFKTSIVVEYIQGSGAGNEFGEYGLIKFIDGSDDHWYYSNLPIIVMGNENGEI